jgi:hypothetical protein
MYINTSPDPEALVFKTPEGTLQAVIYKDRYFLFRLNEDGSDSFVASIDKKPNMSCKDVYKSYLDKIAAEELFHKADVADYAS